MGHFVRQREPRIHPSRQAMTKPIPDKAEVALEYPDKFYIGTFDRTSRFDAHLDATGLSLTLERPGDENSRKSIHMHVNYDLLAEILGDVAGTVTAMRADDMAHRESLADAAKALHHALAAKRPRIGGSPPKDRQS
jgi:hypothetical protein